MTTGKTNVYDGLLRKYKISKLVDTVKLSKQELAICKHLDKTLIGLNKSIPDSTPYGISVDYRDNHNNFILRYTIYSMLSVSTICHEFLDQYLHYSDKQLLIQSWIEELYDIQVEAYNIHFLVY